MSAYSKLRPSFLTDFDPPMRVLSSNVASVWLGKLGLVRRNWHWGAAGIGGRRLLPPIRGAGLILKVGEDGECGKFSARGADAESDAGPPCVQTDRGGQRLVGRPICLVFEGPNRRLDSPGGIGGEGGRRILIDGGRQTEIGRLHGKAGRCPQSSVLAIGC